MKLKQWLGFSPAGECSLLAFASKPRNQGGTALFTATRRVMHWDLAVSGAPQLKVETETPLPSHLVARYADHFHT